MAKAWHVIGWPTYDDLNWTYLREKNAFSVSPAQAAATASTKVEMPKVEWIGTRLARNEAVALSQQSNSKKLKKPTMN